MDIIQGVNDFPLPRLLEPQLASLLGSFPAVVVTGARQTGKSTLVQQAAGSPPRTYLTLDDLEILERARLQPATLVGPGSSAAPNRSITPGWAISPSGSPASLVAGDGTVK
jgi:hypothetical protein